MDVRYTLSLDDYWQFQKFYYFPKRVQPAIFYPFVALVALLFFAGTYSNIDKWLHHGVVDYIGLLTPLSVIMWIWLWKMLLMKTRKSSASFGEEVYLKMDNQYIMTATRTRETKLAWSTIYKVVDAKHYIYVFMSKTYAIIVPKRVFSNEAAATAFFVAATSYRQNAVPGLALNETSDATSWPPSPRIAS